MRKKVDAAVAYAEANEKARITDLAILNGRQTIHNIITSTNALEAASEQIKSGKIKTEEQLTRYLEEQAYWAEIQKQIEEGTLQIDKARLAELKAQRDAAQERLTKEQEELKKLENLYQSIGDRLSSTITSAMESGRLDVKSFLLDVVQMIISSKIKEVFAEQFSVGSGGGGNFLSNLLQVGSALFGGNAANAAASGASASGVASVGYAKGGAFNNGVEFFANGGVVNRTTGFGMAGGKWGVMGEAGPEAIMPLSRGRNGKLGVAATGGGGTVNQVNVAPGAVVVNSSGDNAADTAAFAKSLDKLFQEKIAMYIRDQQRSGNSMNPNFGYRY